MVLIPRPMSKYYAYKRTNVAWVKKKNLTEAKICDFGLILIFPSTFFHGYGFVIFHAIYPCPFTKKKQRNYKKYPTRTNDVEEKIPYRSQKCQWLKKPTGANKNKTGEFRFCTGKSPEIISLPNFRHTIVWPMFWCTYRLDKMEHVDFTVYFRFCTGKARNLWSSGF